MAVVVAIDPGNNSGWSIMSVTMWPRLLASGSLKLDKTSPTSCIKEKIKPILDTLGDKTMIGIIEDQYVAKNIKSSLSLARTSGRWQEALIQIGITPSFVEASEWQSAELSCPRNRVALKAAALAKVKAIFQIDTTTDTADAIMLGRYWAIKLTRSLALGIK